MRLPPWWQFQAGLVALFDRGLGVLDVINVRRRALGNAFGLVDVRRALAVTARTVGVRSSATVPCFVLPMASTGYASVSYVTARTHFVAGQHEVLSFPVIRPPGVRSAEQGDAQQCGGIQRRTLLKSIFILFSPSCLMRLQPITRQLLRVRRNPSSLRAENRFPAARAFRLLVGDAEVAFDAGQVLALSAFVSGLCSLGLQFRTHGTFAMAVPAFAGIGALHRRPYPLCQFVAVLFEFLGVSILPVSFAHSSPVACTLRTSSGPVSRGTWQSDRLPSRPTHCGHGEFPCIPRRRCPASRDIRCRTLRYWSTSGLRSRRPRSRGRRFRRSPAGTRETAVPTTE